LSDQNNDRNFDDLVDRFELRIHNSSKGKLRQAIIWRDLVSALPALEKSAYEKPLRVLDVGGGLGHFSIKLAQLGHYVVFNDLSIKMTKKAKILAKKTGVVEKIEWQTGAFQGLIDQIKEEFDLILCHALIEWLAQPEQLIPSLTMMLKPGGRLSLCFYHRAGIVYRNLIKGNFNWVKNQKNYLPDPCSLTPYHPHTFPEVQNWLNNSGLSINSVSGIRVFSDYTVQKRGGLYLPEEVFEMELSFSQQEPYKWLGRYLHIMAHSCSN